MSWLDWSIVAVPALVVLWFAIRTRRHMRGVPDFLAADRGAGRYLLANASGESGIGAITLVALFEMYYRSGFVMGWWNCLGLMASAVIMLTGYCLYRYRETRALTLAQFFEIRYSRRFRIYAGFLCALSGVLNYAIFPAVAARFFVSYCGFPLEVHAIGLSIPTFIPVMALLLGLAASFALLGGQLTALVTDCVEGLITSGMYVAITIFLLFLVPWPRLASALGSLPAGQSLLNPFDSWKVADFNLWYALIGIVYGGFYGALAWQGSQGFNCAAKSPHEAKMGAILGSWRFNSKVLMITLMAVCAYAFLNHPAYSAQAGGIRHDVSLIPNETLQTQLRVPIVLSHMLPMGLKGMLCAIAFFAMMACDCSYLHSWGSIIVQDLVLPLRRSPEPPSPTGHLRMLRWSIAGVTLFAFIFSALFRQTDFIYMYFSITATIFVGGAGSAIVGGLYWRRGTTAAAWTAMTVGSVLGVAGIVVRQLRPGFPINGVWMSAITMVIAVAAYVVVSLLGGGPGIDMDRLLHRGCWAVEGGARPAAGPAGPWWKRLIGMDHQFTRRDKVISIGIFAWNALWLVAFLVITAWNVLFRAWPLAWWSRYWFVAGALVPLLVGVFTTIWFAIGGVRDLRELLRGLEARDREGGRPGA
jgi:solute:Na+ symporter, SSS family